MTKDEMLERFATVEKLREQAVQEAVAYCRDESKPLDERYDLFSAIPERMLAKEDWIVHFKSIPDDALYAYSDRYSTVDVIDRLVDIENFPEDYEEIDLDAAKEEILQWGHRELTYDW